MKPFLPPALAFLLFACNRDANRPLPKLEPAPPLSETAAVARNSPTLRIATFNLKWLASSADESRKDPWNTEGELGAHRRDLARVLAENVQADLVCVIEVLSRPALEKLVAEPALRPLGYKVYHLESEDTGTGQDVAFLSRLPLDRVQGEFVRRFSREGKTRASARGRGRKGKTVHLTKNAAVYVSVGGLKLGLLGLHLRAHPDDRGITRKREVQAEIAAGLIREEIVARGYVPVVLGDLNDFDPEVTEGLTHPEKRRVLPTLKDFDAGRPGPELFNAAERIPIAMRYSSYWDKNHNERRDEGEPVALLDHILLHRSLSKRLRKAEILHAAHDGTVSDHWPVVVELTLTPG